MAKVETQNPDQMAAAMALMAQTLQALQQNQPEKNVTFGDTAYQEKLKAETKRFPRPVFQHRLEANPESETDETIRLTGELVPGKYFNGLVTIEALKNGGINFKYDYSPDKRMSHPFRSFAELVAGCHAEAQARISAAV